MLGYGTCSPSSLFDMVEIDVFRRSRRLKCIFVSNQVQQPRLMDVREDTDARNK